jgi:hypothetical protein
MVHQKFSVNLQKSLLHFLPILGPGFSGFGQDIYFNYSAEEDPQDPLYRIIMKNGGEIQEIQQLNR